MFHSFIIDSFDIRDYRRRHRGPAILLATRCYGSPSSTQANPTTITQSGPGQQASGSGSVAGGQGSLNVGSGGTYLEQGAQQTDVHLSDAQVAGAANDTQLSNVTNSGTGDINITDNGAVQAAADLAGRVVDSQQNAFQTALDANQSNLSNILDAANKLESTSASGASAQLLNTLLYLGMGVIAIVGIWLLFRRR